MKEVRDFMKERFEGDPGRRLRIEALAGQKMILGNMPLAEEVTYSVFVS